MRIFREFVAGASPKAIAKQLNAESVPGPRGGSWGPSTIYGHARRGTGILNNELYIGRLLWNRQQYVKNPETGKRVSRRNAPQDLVRTDVPTLRIVTDELWNAVKMRQQSTRQLSAAAENPAGARRPTFLLTGLTKCGVCGSGFTMASKNRLACAGARDRGICENRLTIRRDEVERRVLNAMEYRLWKQGLFDEFFAEFTRERNRLHNEASAAASAALREQGRIDRRLDEIVEWISSGAWRESPAMDGRVRDELAELERRKAQIASDLQTAERAKEARPLLHPEMGKQYKAWVIDLRAGLTDDDRRLGAMTALRAMVEEAVLTPENGGLSILLKGDLAAMLATASPKDDLQDLRRQVKLVAGACNRRDLARWWVAAWLPA